MNEIEFAGERLEAIKFTFGNFPCAAGNHTEATKKSETDLTHFRFWSRLIDPSQDFSPTIVREF